MSYMVLRRPYGLSSLGAAASYTATVNLATSTAASALPPCDINTGNATADADFKKCCEEAKQKLTGRPAWSVTQVANQIKTCSTQAITVAAKDLSCNKVKTGIAYIDTAFHNCCEGAWKSSGSVAERTKSLALCTANAAASGYVAATFATAGTIFCAAAGAATAGISTALAASGLCAAVAGTVGVFLYNRIQGYSTGALVVGGIMGVACGVVAGPLIGFACGIAAAELVRFLSEVVGPLLEKIFDPDAAERRRRAEVAAARALRDATRQNLYEAQGQVIEQWKATIDRVWTLYEKVLPSQLRNGAKNTIGITNTYDSIARAVIQASKGFPTQAEVDYYGGYDAAQRAVAGGKGAGMPYHQLSSARIADIKSRKTYTAGCEIYGRLSGGNYGPLSDMCPIFPEDEFMDEDASSGDKKDLAYYKALAAKYSVEVTDFFVMLPIVEVIVSNTITSYAAGAMFSDSVYQAKTATKVSLAARAQRAAGLAEAAADAALKGNAKEGAAAILKAKNNYVIASAALTSLISSTWGETSSASIASMCASDSSCTKASAAVVRAKKFSELAVTNAAHAATMRFALGSALAAGAAGALYLWMRK